MEIIVKCPKCKSENCQLLVEDGIAVISCSDCEHKQEDVGLNEVLDWVGITT